MIFYLGNIYYFILFSILFQLFFILVSYMTKYDNTKFDIFYKSIKEQSFLIIKFK